MKTIITQFRFLRTMQIGSAVAAILLVLNGCVAFNAMPMSAQAGDTIILAVGSADGMDTTNTTVEFFTGTDPTVVTPVPITIRSISKVYPDKTSHAWLGADPHKISKRSTHGGWLSILVVDLPADNSQIPEGPGLIRVTTNGQVLFPRLAAQPNDSDMAITILPGLGGPNPFTYYAFTGGSKSNQLVELDSLPQAIITPPIPATDAEAEANLYGAIEMQVTAPIIASDGGAISDDGIAVILDDQPQNIDKQVSIIWKRTGDDFTIMLVSPKGMYSYQSRVSIVPLFPEYFYKINGTPLLQSITYYDLDGFPAAGPGSDPTIRTIPNNFF